MGSKSQAVRGVAFNWLGRGCSLLIAFVVTPILIRILGDESYGIWAIVMSLTQYYALADMGLRGAAVKYVAQHHARGDHEAANRTIVTSLAAYGLLGSVVLLVAAVVAFFFPQTFEVGAHSDTTIRLVVLLTGAQVAIRILAQPFDGTLAALHRFDLTNMVAVTAQILQAILMVTVLTLGGGLIGMAAVTLGVTLLRQGANVGLVYRVIPTLSLSPKYLSRADLKTLFGFGSLSVVTGVARRITQSGGGLLVGFFLGPTSVAFYSVAEMLVLRAGGLNKGVTSVVMPLASQLEAKEESESLRDVLFVVTRNLLAMALTFATVFIALGYPLIEFWIKPEYAPKTYPVLCLLALAMVLRMPSNCGRNILKGMAQQHFLVILGVIDIVITLGFGSLMLTRHGLIGMAWATLLSQAITSGLMLPWLICRKLQISPGQYLLRCVAPGIVATLPAMALGMLLKTQFPPGALWQVVFQAGLIGATAAGGIYLACFNQEERRKVLRAVSPGKRKKPKATV